MDGYIVKKPNGQTYGPVRYAKAQAYAAKHGLVAEPYVGPAGVATLRTKEALQALAADIDESLEAMLRLSVMVNSG